MVELIWSGKYDAQGRRRDWPRPGVRPVTLEQHGAPGDGPPDRLLFGDNLMALDALVEQGLAGKIDLAYLDPPFGTGGRFTVSTRVGEGGSDGRPPPEIDQPAYADRFEGGVDGLLAMLEPRLRLVHELLAPHGSLYLHVDPTVGHAAKLLLDEVFGPSSFQREIVWRIGWVSGFKSKARNWIRNHDLIFFYTKDPKSFVFNKIYTPYPPGYTRRDGSPPKGPGMPIEDVWNANDTELALRGRDSLDSIQIKSFSGEKSGYATQKNESLLRRIVAASSDEGALVLDPFCGSGTTAVAARELGRRFIGCDASAAALHIAKKRMLDATTDRGVQFESVEAHGWELAATDPSWWSRLLIAVGAPETTERDPGEGVAFAVADRGAVAVLDPRRTLDGPMLRRLIERAQSAGATGLEVVARTIQLPWPRPKAAIDLVVTRLGGEWLAPTFHPPAPPPFSGAADRGGLREIPELELALACAGPDGQLDLPGTEPGTPLSVSVTGVHHHDRARWPGVLQELETFEAVLDAWWVQWKALDEPGLRPDAYRFRTHQRRTLPLSCPLRAPDGARIRVGIHDVRHEATYIEGGLAGLGSDDPTLTDGIQR